MTGTRLPMRIGLVAAGAAVLLVGFGPGPQPDPPVTEIRSPRNQADAQLIGALTDYIPHVMTNRGTPGLNLALARGGEIIWEAGFGYADLDQRRPMAPDTVTHSGSMGKTYVATAVMQLVERGVIGLEDPINTYLSEFKITNPLGDREITFKDLLTHTSGLATNTAGSQFSTPKPLAEHVREGYAKPTFEPYQGTVIPRWTAKVGQAYQYSNFGMATLGYLVQVANPERLSFSDYVQKHIMDPLGMTSSQYPPVQDAEHVRPDIFARMSTGYSKWGFVDFPTAAMYFADFPAGTVVTIPRDHIKLLLAYMNNGSYNGYQLLKPETVALMLQPQVGEMPGKPASSEVDVGLTWRLDRYGKHDVCFSHGGAHMYGWNNDFRAYPKLDVAVVVFTNHWGMGARDRESVMIGDFIATWRQLEEPFVVPRETSPEWAWKTSYVIGLLTVDAYQGVLGIPEPLTPDMVEAMEKGARIREGAYAAAAGWDPQGFRAGVQDMLAVEMTMNAVRAFLRSDKLRVTRDELRQILLELGANPENPEIFAFVGEYVREK